MQQEAGWEGGSARRTARLSAASLDAERRWWRPRGRTVSMVGRGGREPRSGWAGGAEHADAVFRHLPVVSSGDSLVSEPKPSICFSFFAVSYGK